MSRIFGISDLPIPTIETALRGTVYEPPVRQVVKTNRPHLPVQKIVSKHKNFTPKSFIKMRNGFGKLMQNFNKIK